MRYHSSGDSLAQQVHNSHLQMVGSLRKRESENINVHSTVKFSTVVKPHRHCMFARAVYRCFSVEEKRRLLDSVGAPFVHASRH